VRRAYLRTSVKVHPDKHPNYTKEATIAFQRISEAYDGLKDEQGRREYASEFRSDSNCRGFAPKSTTQETDKSSSSQGRNYTSRSTGCGVSPAQAAAFFAAAFAAEMATGNIPVPQGVGMAMGAMGSAMDLAATMKVANDILKSK
jgi:curved DNA-binding protein CbpA